MLRRPTMPIRSNISRLRACTTMARDSVVGAGSLSFVNNIAHASTGTVDQKTGTVTLGASARSVTVQLKQAP